ncbi:MAG: metal ABC transporter permease [Burkholderiales bacterium]
MSGLEWTLLAPAFVAGCLVLATHVPLGLQVLARGIVFIDLAVAQLAALGVLGAELAGWEPHGLAMQGVAVGAALLGGLALTHAERRWPEVQEALIGVLFVLAASAGILLVAHNPHAGEHLQDMLAGQILWVGWPQVAALAAVTAVLLAVLYLGRASRARFLFYGVFACAVTASVQMVGVYLVFASLIVPALAVRRLPQSSAVLLGLACGAAGYALGLVASALWDLPAGAVIVWALALCALALGLRLRR